jgi:Holliday junction resolvasome RuvABC endonuclease subunit
MCVAGDPIIMTQCANLVDAQLITQRVMMKILALDLSLNSTGWALVGGAAPTVGVLRSPVGGDAGAKLLAQYAIIKRMIEAWAPGAIIIEQIFVGPNRQTVIALAQVHGVVRMAAAELGVSVVYQTTSAVRKSLGQRVGRRIKTKLDAFNAIVELGAGAYDSWGFAQDNDCTDALALALAFAGAPR